MSLVLDAIEITQRLEKLEGEVRSLTARHDLTVVHEAQLEVDRQGHERRLAALESTSAIHREALDNQEKRIDLHVQTQTHWPRPAHRPPSKTPERFDPDVLRLLKVARRFVAEHWVSGPGFDLHHCKSVRAVDVELLNELFETLRAFKDVELDDG